MIRVSEANLNDDGPVIIDGDYNAEAGRQSDLTLTLGHREAAFAIRNRMTLAHSLEIKYQRGHFIPATYRKYILIFSAIYSDG